MKAVLVLRPEPGASATVAKARERGLNAVAVPLFEIEPVGWNAPEPSRFDGLLLTSANAVRSAGEQLRELRILPVYAVGEATADAARGAGFDIAATGDAGVDRLLASIDADLNLLHLCGEDRRGPSAARQQIESVVIYRAKPIHAPDLSAAADSVALIHSPRAGSRFVELVDDRASVALAAISQAAADAAGHGWAAVEVAEEPNDEALLALAAMLCNKPGAE
jgi:uroporphyrinogen-III synthase